MPRLENGPNCRHCGRWTLAAVAVALCLVSACSREAKKAAPIKIATAPKVTAHKVTAHKVAPDKVAPDKAATPDPFTGTKAGEERTFGDMKFCWCPPGKFTMGSPKTDAGRSPDVDPVNVTLTQGFWLGKHEVTQAEYERVMSSNPSHFKGNQLPVETVSWEDATKFCEKLTETERTAGRRPKGWAYRLPMEAQWEYACRAGTTTAYCFGDDPQQLGDYAWYHTNAENKTHDVGQKKANAWGLHDMHGNVWEWCQYWYGVYPRGAVTDPTGAAPGSYRVYRGGGWYDAATACRTADRDWFLPSCRLSYLGFRVALVQTSKSK